MANTIKKNAQGYGYKYTDLAEIHNYLEAKGWTYYQYIEVIDGNDYIMTITIDENGKESKPMRGCRVVQATLNGKTNPAQEQGSALTYARRYSLLLCLGLATVDSDAAELTEEAIPPKNSERVETIKALMDIKGIPLEEVLKISKFDRLEDFDDNEFEGCINWLKQQ